MSIPVTPAADGQWWKQMLSERTVGAAEPVSAEPAAMTSGVIEEATPTQVAEAVREINTSLQSRSVGLQFELDEDTDKMIVKVVDRTSGEVIRQIPSEEVVRIAKVLGKAPGLLVSQAA
ncbi:flagellar protein FlaG [Variovorax paradoxus]|uniref:flagellar protein FlaG n=1 Tax=Variovorax paradoxus TaxID=34073 RepID=UPI002790574F|nr:flagellar protein FlaG [Variovorax paradoxus]MDQ0568648.1 flagellar protein FlaG [Variovorax paradoxus]